MKKIKGFCIFLVGLPSLNLPFHSWRVFSSDAPPCSTSCIGSSWQALLVPILVVHLSVPLPFLRLHSSNYRTLLFPVACPFACFAGCVGSGCPMSSSCVALCIMQVACGRGCGGACGGAPGALPQGVVRVVVAQVRRALNQVLGSLGKCGRTR